jgi:hypothetical protein
MYWKPVLALGCSRYKQNIGEGLKTALERRSTKGAREDKRSRKTAGRSL